MLKDTSFLQYHLRVWNFRTSFMSIEKDPKIMGALQSGA